MAALPFDRLPLSRYGSWLAVSLGEDGLPLIRDIHGGDYGAPWIFRIRFADHDPLDLRCGLRPAALEAVSRKDGSRLGIVCGGHDDLYLRAEGLSVILETRQERYNSLIPLDGGEYEYQLYAINRKIRLRGSASGGGIVEFHSQWKISESAGVFITLDGRKGRAGLDLQSYAVTPEFPFSDYDHEKEAGANHFAGWTAPLPAGGEYAEAAKYTLWGNFVHAEGALGYDALYMNKLSMTNIWSWDNCFSAIALAKAHPQRALEQLLVILDHQHSSGALPDYVNDLFASYSCVKPPVYGWTVQKLREQNDFFYGKEVSALLYDKISKLTAFWLERRMRREWGLCYYLHGNDSGWDNASVFHRSPPLCGADLAAYLTRQMDALSEMAAGLEKPAEAALWKERAEAMFNAMIERLHTPDGFVSRGLNSGEADGEAKSLINLLPLLVHYRMEASMKESLVRRLEEFEGEHGLATERLDSRYYRKGGYWLGPIWAPVSLLFIDSLYSAGYGGMAARLAEKFRRLPSTGLMAENFDPQTGQGYDGNAFAWTAAVYLFLEKYGGGPKDA
ncbi:MAG: hypothetical protein LBG84_05600 [Treponema sp.]|jgi:hypothetical protein|nr:hypothetical protein [Treponema sp.]